MLLLMVITLNSCNKLQREETRLQHIEIINEGRIPIMKIDIKGERYTFLLDSGSPESIIHCTVITKRQLKVQTEENLKSTLYDIYKKDYVELINTRFYIHDIGKTKEKILYHTGEEVDGVIGADALYKNKSVIDFDKEIITHFKAE